MRNKGHGAMEILPDMFTVISPVPSIAPGS